MVSEEDLASVHLTEEDLSKCDPSALQIILARMSSDHVLKTEEPFSIKSEVLPARDQSPTQCDNFMTEYRNCLEAQYQHPRSCGDFHVRNKECYDYHSVFYQHQWSTDVSPNCIRFSDYSHHIGVQYQQQWPDNESSHLKSQEYSNCYTAFNQQSWLENESPENSRSQGTHYEQLWSSEESLPSFRNQEYSSDCDRNAIYQQPFSKLGFDHSSVYNSDELSTSLAAYLQSPGPSNIYSRDHSCGRDMSQMRFLEQLEAPSPLWEQPMPQLHPSILPFESSHNTETYPSDPVQCFLHQESFDQGSNPGLSSLELFPCKESIPLSLVCPRKKALCSTPPPKWPKKVTRGRGIRNRQPMMEKGKPFVCLYPGKFLRYLKSF